MTQANLDEDDGSHDHQVGGRAFPPERSRVLRISRRLRVGRDGSVRDGTARAVDLETQAAARRSREAQHEGFARRHGAQELHARERERYRIEGGASRDYILTKRMMHQEPKAWHAFMDKLSASISAYLRAQIRAGADALQLFDSWAGALGPDDYCEYVLPYVQQIVQSVTAEKEVPFIYFSTGTSGLLELISQTGANVIGVDWRVNLAKAWERLGKNVAIQGNLDPTLLLMPFSEIKKQAVKILDSVRGKPGHIFNLGHGVLEPTPVEHVQALVEFVHEYSR